MANPVPPAIRGQKYISLITLRKSGAPVPTPVWFGEEGDKLYVMTASRLGKYKRIRNNPQVRVAPCTIRGRVTGPECPAVARILPKEEHQHAHSTIRKKYWMARIPFLWSRSDVLLELSF
jgi:uncharacterized protein